MLKLLFSLMLLVNVVAWFWWSALPSESHLHRENTVLQERIKGSDSLALLSEWVAELPRVNSTVRYPAPETLLISVATRPQMAFVSFPEELVVEERVLSEAVLDSTSEPEVLPIDQSSPSLDQSAAVYKESATPQYQLMEANVADSGGPSTVLDAKPAIRATNLEEQTDIEATQIQQGSLARQNICMRLGPFSDDQQLTEIENSITQMPMSVSRVALGVAKQRYWVILPPLEAALRQEVEAYLVGKGVQPFELGEGEYSDHLSAGYFQRLENAENFAIELVSMVGEVLVKPLETEEPIRWLEVIAENDQHLAKLAEIQQSDAQLLLSECAELADR